MKVLFTILAGLCGILPLAQAQPGAGRPYEARDPFVCASKVEPKTGAPSGDRLRDLVRCGRGGEKVYDGDLYLL